MKNKKQKTKNNCNNIVVIGAVAELEKLTGKNITDLVGIWPVIMNHRRLT